MIVIAARILYRWFKSKRFKGDDKWMVVAGVSFIFLLNAPMILTLSDRPHWIHSEPDWDQRVGISGA